MTYCFFVFLLRQGIVYKDIFVKVYGKGLCAASAAAWMAYPSGSLECANFSVMYQGTGYFSDGNGNAGGDCFFLFGGRREELTKPKVKDYCPTRRCVAHL